MSLRWEAMKSQDIQDIMSGKTKSLPASIARAGLAIASLPYGAIMSLRRRAYGVGLLKSHKAPLPVICVGNLTAGGTGKTPMVAWVVQKLIEAGKTPAILTRGYKAVAGVSDEAELLRELTGVEVIINPDRLAGARQAAEAEADVLVMDDGFQHLRLRRDLNIVLIDARNPLGYNWLLPRGLLRERPSALKSAHAIVITHSNRISPPELEKLSDRLEKLARGARVYWAVHQPVAVIDENGTRLPIDALLGQQLWAFAGIANPDGFFNTLKALGAKLLGHQGLDDHAEYTKPTIDAINLAAEASTAKAFITTQKDFPKLKILRTANLDLPLWQLAIEIQIIDGQDHLTKLIKKTLAASK